MSAEKPESTHRIDRPREPWFLRSRLRLYAVLVFALAVPCIALSLLVALEVKSELRDQAERENALVATMVARSVQEQFTGLRNYVRSYADRIKFSAAVCERDTAFATMVLAQMVAGNDLVSRVFLADTSGVIWIDSPSDPNVIGKTFAHRDWYRGLLPGRGVHVSEIYRRLALGQPYTVALSARVFSPAGEYCGILVAQVTIDDLSDWFFELGLPQDRTIALVDQHGHWFDNNHGVEARSEFTDTLTFAGYIGRSHYAVERPDPVTQTQSLISSIRIGDVGWTVVARHRLDHVYASSRAIQRALLLYFAVGLLGMMVIGGTMYRVLRRYDSERNQSEARLRQAYADVEAQVRHRTAELTAANRELRRMAAIIESSSDAIASLTLDGIVTSMNPAGERIYGYSQDEVLGRSVSAILAPGQGIDPRAYLSRIASGETLEPFETTRVRKDGRTIHVSLQVSPVRDAAGRVTGVSVISRDITRQKEAEEQTRRLERERAELLARLQMTLDRMPIGCILNDTEFRFTYWNPAAERIFGYSFEEVRGRHPFGLITPESSQPLVADVFRLLAEGGRDVDATGENVTKDGRKIICVWHNSSLRDSDGRFLGIISMCQDITEQKRDEERLRLYAAALAQNNRELQDFAFVASHDLQEPLRKIAAFGKRLDESAGAVLSAESRDYLERMQIAAERMRTLINDLLDLSRVATRAEPFAPTDLNGVAAEVISDLESRIEQCGGQVEIGDLPVVEADRVQMRQLLQNLIANGLKFHRPDVPPVVRVQAAVLADGAQGADPVQVCRMTVEDNGIGFDQKHLERIFAPFQRLHGRHEYEGTGMGLAICRKIVVRHGGTITAISTPGRGSTFIITIPVRQSDAVRTVWATRGGLKALADPLTEKGIQCHD